MKPFQTHNSCTFKKLGFGALVVVVLAFSSRSLFASPTTLTVTISSDNSPGGQMDSATSGDLRYCINYILDQQAQGLAQDYNVVFAPGVTSIQLNARLSMVNLLGSDTIVIGNPDPAPPVVISGGSGASGLFIRRGAVTLQNLNFQGLNAAGGSGGDGGGGGMGAGGALFIDGAGVTLHNVNFSNCSATGGLGSGTTGSGGGGGGLGGNGGSSQGGGGGYAGNGGDNYGAGGGAGGNGGSNLGGGGGAILGTTGGIGGSSPTDAEAVSPFSLSLPATPFVVGGGGYGSEFNGFAGSGAGGNNAGGLGGADVTISLGATLKGTGTINSPTTLLGTLSPGDAIGTLYCNAPLIFSAGSLFRIAINSGGTSLVSSTGPVSLAGNLEIALDAGAQPGSYTILTSSGLTGTFDSVTFTGPTPNYSLSYLPTGAPTYVQFDLLAPNPSPSPSPTPSPSPSASPTPIPSPTPGQLINISSRAKVDTGDQVSINGFILRGSASKKILARAVGPSLASNNQAIPGRLLDPVLELHGSNGSLIFSNDDWTTSPQAAEIEASGLAPNDSREPAIIATLPEGSYTTIIRGKDNASGIALGEVYVLPPNDDASALLNLSARALTLSGDDVLIAGLIVGGQTSKQILFRAIGPELHGSVTGELEDPTLSLYDANGALLGTNDNWGDATNHAQIQATGLAPTDNREAAILLTLPPRNYTAIVRGVNGTIGVALVEVYVLQ